MSTNGISYGTKASIDFNKAKILLTTYADRDETIAEIDHRHARSLAIELLRLADQAERQRAQNLTKANHMMASGDLEDAALFVEDNGFSDEELNEEFDRMMRAAAKKIGK